MLKNVHNDQENNEIRNISETSQQLDDTVQHSENEYTTVFTTKLGKLRKLMRWTL